MASTSSRVLKNTGFLYLRMGLTLFVSLWTTRIILNALGADNFGIYSLVGGIIGLLGFLNGSLSSATQRYINFSEGRDDLQQKKVVFNNSLVLHGVLALVLVVLFAVVGIVAFDAILSIPQRSTFAAKCVYACMIFSTALSVMNVPYESLINAHEDMGYYAAVGILEVVFKLIIAFIIAHTSTDRLILYGVLMALVPLVTLTIMKIYCHRRYKECMFAPIAHFDIGTIRELGSFAGWNFLNSASGIVTQGGFNIVINHFFGVVLNAAQGIAIQVSGVLVGMSSNALKVLNPIIVKKESTNQREQMLYVSMLGCRATFFIFAACSIPLVSEMDIILRLWLKNVPQWAVIFCQLQLVRITTEMLSHGLNSAIMAQGDIKRYNIYKSITNFLPLIVTSALFYFEFPPYWMYIVWIVCWSGIGGLINIWFTHRNTGMSYSFYNKSVLYPGIISTIIPVTLIIVGKTFVDTFWADISIVAFAEILFLILSWNILLTTAERKELIRLSHSLIHK